MTTNKRLNFYCWAQQRVTQCAESSLFRVDTCFGLLALQVLQELPLLNAGSDAPMTATATLTGKGFSGPREVSVQAKADGW